MFVVLAAVLQGLMAAYWIGGLKPRLWAEAESNARALAQAQAQALADALSPRGEEIDRVQIERTIDRILLPKASGRQVPFIVGVELELDYDVVEAVAGELDLSQGDVGCRSCFMTPVPLYSRVNRELLGIARLYGSDHFFERLKANVRGRMIWVSCVVLVLLVLSWWVVAILLRPLSALAASLEDWDVQEPRALAHLGGRPSEEIRMVKDALDDLLGKIREHTAAQEGLIRQLEAKNAELERYTYTVSHDLKGPLITIKGFLGLVCKSAEAGDLEQFHADVTIIGDAADQMNRLLDELLELSRIDHVIHPPEEVSLSVLAQEAADHLSGAIGERAIEIRIAEDLPTVRGDRIRLLQLFQILIENAVKFMGDQPEPRIEIGCRRDEEEPVCYVRDNGMGIDPRYHKRIFGLFDQLDQKSAGTGIGLTLLTRIVDVHLGRIWVESDGPGKGSCFYFTLPGL